MKPCTWAAEPEALADATSTRNDAGEALLAACRRFPKAGVLCDCRSR